MFITQRIFVPGSQLLWIFAVRTQRLRDNLGGYDQQSKTSEVTIFTHLVSGWILSSMDSRSAHLMNPLVETRSLLQREVPPDKLEGTIARNLLATSDKASDVGGVNIVALLVGSGVHSRRSREVEKRGIVGFLVKRLERKC